MWTVIKFDYRQIEILRNEFKKQIGENMKIYIPKVNIKSYKNKKKMSKNHNLLGNYLLCFHEKFNNESFISSLKFTKGLKYFLQGHITSQNEICNFVEKCKEHEDQNGYILTSFFDLYLNSNYEFASGPFVSKIFKIIKLQKNYIDISLENLKLKINKKNFYFKPV